MIGGWGDFINALIEGAVAGMIIAFTGYIKNISANGELPKFNSAKFASTIILGAIAGVVARLYNLSYDTATNMLISAGIVTFVEYSVKALFRYLKSKGYNVVEERTKLNETKELSDEEKLYKEIISKAKDYLFLFQSYFGIGSKLDLKKELTELGNMYEEFLNKMELKAVGYKDVELMDLSGRLRVKQRDIPNILRGGDLEKAYWILYTLAKINDYARMEEEGK
jgi:hypothetical protein